MRPFAFAVPTAILIWYVILVVAGLPADPRTWPEFGRQQQAETQLIEQDRCYKMILNLENK
jgi:hypothetical protein